VTLSIAHLHPRDGELVVLALHGTLDQQTARQLGAAITAEAAPTPRPRSIVVDLTDVERVDQAGVGCLVSGNRACAAAGVGLAVRGTSPLIRALLQLQPGHPAPGAPANRWCTPVRPARRLRRRPAESTGPPSASTHSRPRRGR
jgi:anti-anti-sigma factor